MTLITQVALVSEATTSKVSAEELGAVSAALQKQVTRDLAQYWPVQATVDPFIDLAHVPSGYWPVVIRDDIMHDEAGVHCDENKQPFALVTSGFGWSVVASHEILEMLVDPFGNRLIAGDSVEPGQGRVEYLVEVADPVGTSIYKCNGIEVADFITPRYFDPVSNSLGVYSFTGTIRNPHEVLPGGYLTWRDPVSGDWWQRQWFDADQPSPANRNIGVLPREDCTLRAMIDQHTRKIWAGPRGRAIASREDERNANCVALSDGSQKKAERLRARIDGLVARNSKSMRK